VAMSAILDRSLPRDGPLALSRRTWGLGATNKLVSFNLADLCLEHFPTGRQNCQLLARGLTSIMWCAV
jgi:hypothetical protein